MATEINLKGNRIPTISTQSKISKADQKLFSTKTKAEILQHLLATQGVSISAITYTHLELQIGVPDDENGLVDFFLQIGTKQSPMSATVDDVVIRVMENDQVIFQIAVDSVESIRYGQSNSIVFEDDTEDDDGEIQIDDKMFQEFMQLVAKHEKAREEKAKIEAEKEIVVDFRKKTTTKTQSKKKK